MKVGIGGVGVVCGCLFVASKNLKLLWVLFLVLLCLSGGGVVDVFGSNEGVVVDGVGVGVVVSVVVVDVVVVVVVGIDVDGGGSNCCCYCCSYTIINSYYYLHLEEGRFFEHSQANVWL